jgi:hypothetical protein
VTLSKLLRHLLIDQFVFGVEADGVPPADNPSDGGAPPSDSTAPPADGPTDAPSNYFGSVPDSWRNDLVSRLGFEGDEAEKRAKQLERFTGIDAFAKSAFEAQDKIRKGELSSGLPENPTDEQLREWREANGVPDSPDGYQLQFDGVEVSETQQEIYKAALEQAFNGNVSNDTANAMINAAAKAQAQIAERQIQQDGVDAQQGAQVLRDTWGSDYQANINRVDGLLSRIPEEIRDSFKGGRLADGRAILNSPEMMQFLADVSRKVDPAATVVPNSSNPLKTIQDEIKSLEARMGDADWYRDKAANDRLMELYEAEQQMQGG